MEIYIPFLVAIVGVLVYALASNPKVSEIGRVLFWTGTLVTLFQVAGHSTSILR